MRVVEIFEIDTTAEFLGTILPGRNAGAYGVSIDVFENDAATDLFILAGLSQLVGSDEMNYVVGRPSHAGIQPSSFGGPITAQFSRLYWLLAGTKRATLTFWDEPIPPYGTLKLLTFTQAAIPPAGISQPASLDNPGSWAKGITLATRATQTHNLRADFTASPDYTGDSNWITAIPSLEHRIIHVPTRPFESAIFRMSNAGAAAADWFLSVWANLD